jgi:hypothetical protein
LKLLNKRRHEQQQHGQQQHGQQQQQQHKTHKLSQRDPWEELPTGLGLKHTWR